MVPRPWTGFWRGLWLALFRAGSVQPDEQTPDWKAAASRRRAALVAIVLASTAIAASLLFHTQSTNGVHPVLHFIQLAIFVVLFGWVTAGFVTAMMGFWVQSHPDRHALPFVALDPRTLDRDARTAVIMPICNEPVAAVFAGLRATCESLASSEAAALFDVYVLSDTSDPDLRAQELAAWSDLQAQLGGRSRIYYRLRQRRTRRKAGNVADFCRRWGRNYRYMVVLDADSVMSGESIATLVGMMEANPQAGIIQTAPRVCGVHTLHARAQQFAGRVAGRLFTAGMQFWQLGESHYWGHNAIIRVEPFMQHCALDLLPGRGGLSGEILSHDFVEAALMRRAGYHTWLTTDLEGSYEQQPSNLMEELQRDRRWCQGNLMNFRLITEPGFQAVHRAMLFTGAMSYVSAPLWLCFLLTSLGLHLLDHHAPALMFPWLGLSSTLGLLWTLTLTMLFLPRVLAVMAIMKHGEQAAYGGSAALIKSALFEAGLSALQAPIRMVAHTLFVIGALTGLNLEWKSPSREAQSVQWRDALRRFMPVMAIVASALLAIFLFQRNAVWWLLPVGLPLLLAVPITVFTSESRWGLSLRRNHWLLTPEERSTPYVLARAWA
ncbi:glucans biosynthesis glucosyltransferase H [mine drainage metagenome]|uniref:Glucans biosynthesis glucosyltransferase H n=1 Tax=mine drainage metagenome TaxID=410659 RepID=A0A1J5TU30_9ZZZZ